MARRGNRAAWIAECRRAAEDPVCARKKAVQAFPLGPSGEGAEEEGRGKSGLETHMQLVKRRLLGSGAGSLPSVGVQHIPNVVVYHRSFEVSG